MAIVMAGPDLAVQLTNRDGLKARYGGAVSARFEFDSLAAMAREDRRYLFRRDARN